MVLPPGFGAMALIDRGLRGELRGEWGLRKEGVRIEGEKGGRKEEESWVLLVWERGERERDGDMEVAIRDNREEEFEN